MAKPAAKAPPEQVEHYERLLATLPGLERKGAQLPYTSVNGNMFTVLGADGVLGLRLSAADREAFLQAHAGKLYEGLRRGDEGVRRGLTLLAGRHCRDDALAREELGLCEGAQAKADDAGEELSLHCQGRGNATDARA
jgi:hypothetical protein